MAKFVHITTNGNIDHYTFEIHKAGCRDVTQKMRKFVIAGPPQPFETDDVDEWLRQNIEIMNADFGEGTWNEYDWHILPCAREG